jgi:hypothetical protein
MIKNIIADLLALLLGVASAVAADTPVIMAHATGVNYGYVDTNIVVATTEQKVFHIHSDVRGEGISGVTWYDVFIGIDGKYLKVRECNSVGRKDKDGKEKMTSTERIFHFPIEMITKDEIELEMKNRIVLTKKP